MKMARIFLLVVTAAWKLKMRPMTDPKKMSRKRVQMQFIDDMALGYRFWDMRYLKSLSWAIVYSD